MYLLDTNILLELLLDQEKADEVELFLQTIPSTECRITEFSLYSLGVILTKRKLSDRFMQFVNDTISGNAMSILRLQENEIIEIINNTKILNLDFDDAYQYTVGEKYNLELVSFDTDFDKTQRGRVTPQQVLERMQKR